MIARLNIGGPAIIVHLLSQGLDTKRFETCLITGNISPQEGDMSYLFTARDRKPVLIPELQRDISITMDMKAIWRIFRILEKQKPDIVHTHTAKAGFSARLTVFIYNLLFRRKIQIVHTFHGHVFEGYFSKFKSKVFTFIERMLARMTNVIIAISETQKRELVEKYRIASADKIKVIELGLNLQPFLNCDLQRGRFRRRWGIDDQVLLVGIIGRLVPIKNHQMFLQGVKHFIAENPHVRATFLVLGDGELREKLESFSRRNGLTEHVRFLGWVRDVAAVYADLDVLALTSMNEGTPISIIEAMASSVSIIATDAGGVADLVGTTCGYAEQNGFKVCQRGILCTKNDPQGFARGLKHLISEDPVQRGQRIERARTYVEQRYPQHRLLRDMEALYSELVQAGKLDPRVEVCTPGPLISRFN